MYECLGAGELAAVEERLGGGIEGGAAVIEETPPARGVVSASPNECGVSGAPVTDTAGTTRSLGGAEVASLARVSVEGFGAAGAPNCRRRAEVVGSV